MPKDRVVNILFTSAGRRVQLLRQFREAAGRLGLGGRLITSDASSLAAARFFGDRHYVTPRCDESTYLACLLEICRRESVGLLVPLIDTELRILSNHRAEFAAIGTCVSISGPHTVQIARDKARTLHYFERIGVGCPAIIEPAVALRSPERFPLFLKPVDGSRSVGSRRIDDTEELRYWLPRTPNPLLVEYLPGDEYTVDVFADAQGRVRVAVPRQRLLVRAGEVCKARTVRNDAIIAGAKQIVRCLDDARGVLNVQCKLAPGGVPKFFEINARFGGGTPLAVHAGADFPAWILAELVGLPYEVTEPGFRPDVLMLRYNDAVFADDSSALPSTRLELDAARAPVVARNLDEPV